MRRRYAAAPTEDVDQAILRLDQLDASQVRVRIVAASEAAAEAAAERAPALLGAADEWAELDDLLADSDEHIDQAMAAVRRRHPGCGCLPRAPCSTSW